MLCDRLGRRAFLGGTVAAWGCLSTSRGALAQPDVWPPHRLVWEMMSPKGVEIYLAPTIHVIARSNPALPTAIEQRMPKSNVILIEADVTDKKDLAKHVALWTYPSSDDSALKHLSPQTSDALRNYLDERKVPAADILKLKPWAIQSIVLFIELKRAGLGTPSSAESLIVSTAKALSKPIQCLESLEAQGRLFDSFPSDIADLRLRDAVTDVTSPVERRQNLIELTEAWYAGSWEKLKSVSDKLNSSPEEVRAFVDRVVILERNKSFADKLDALASTMQPGAAVMISVGFRHYVGKNGLVQLLEDRGYRLKQ